VFSNAIYLFIYKDLFIYLRERQCKGWGGAEGEAGRNPSRLLTEHKPQLRAWSTTLWSRPVWKPRVGCLTDVPPRCPAVLFIFEVMVEGVILLVLQCFIAPSKLDYAYSSDIFIVVAWVRNLATWLSLGNSRVWFSSSCSVNVLKVPHFLGSCKML